MVLKLLTKLFNSDIQTLGSRALKAKKVIDYLYERPMITAITADKVSDIATVSVPYKLITDLEKLESLKK
jgi:hypothetical protein